MHPDKDERPTRFLEATDEMWEDAGHPGWDILEAALDTIPLNATSAEVTAVEFGYHAGLSRWKAWKAKWADQNKVFVEVLVYHREERSPDGIRILRIHPQSEKAARQFCNQEFRKKGLPVQRITKHYWGHVFGTSAFVYHFEVTVHPST